MARTKEMKIKNKSGLKSDGSPNAHWLKFQERLKSHQSIDTNNWSEENILGYILERYENNYQISYSFSFSGPPTKSQEMYCVRRMLATVGTQKPHIAKQYIDWVFDTQIIPSKLNISSIAFFFTKNICDKFKDYYRKNNKITRSSELSSDFIEAAKEFDIQVTTYGDLAFIKLALDKNQSAYQDYFNYFSKIKQLGFDEAILENL